jgi:hypothetical protein
MKRLETAWEKRQRLDRVCTAITGETAEEWCDDEDAPPEVRLRLCLNRRDAAVKQGGKPSGRMQLCCCGSSTKWAGSRESSNR